MPANPVTSEFQMKTDIKPISADLYFIPVQTRVPLKFGSETLTSVTCARVHLTVEDQTGKQASGWGETPLSVQWVWPSNLTYQFRYQQMEKFCHMLANAWPNHNSTGHPIEIGHDFIESKLPILLQTLNQHYPDKEPMPHLAALVCCSAFDLALHDAYGILHNIDIYKTYNAKFMTRDLASFITPADNTNISFTNKYPTDFLAKSPPPNHARLAPRRRQGPHRPL